MSKKRNILYLILGGLLCQCLYLPNVANAAKDHKGKFVIIDGNKVSYDENAVNGRVDVPSNENNVFKELSDNVLKEKNLSIKLETPKNNNYCVPAVTAMTLNSLGLGYFSQDYMAGLLETTRDYRALTGTTVATALNKVVAGSKFRFSWQWHNNINDLNIVRGHITSAIEYGNPVVVNIKESLGDSYLRGHSTGDNLYHFGLVIGYSDYGNKVVYLEPCYDRFSGFVKSKVVSLKDLSYAMEDSGYVW